MIKQPCRRHHLSGLCKCTLQCTDHNFCIFPNLVFLYQVIAQVEEHGQSSELYIVACNQPLTLNFWKLKNSYQKSIREYPLRFTKLKHKKILLVMTKILAIISNFFIKTIAPNRSLQQDLEGKKNKPYLFTAKYDSWLHTHP